MLAAVFVVGMASPAAVVVWIKSPLATAVPRSLAGLGVTLFLWQLWPAAAFPLVWLALTLWAWREQNKPAVKEEERIVAHLSPNSV